MKAKKNTVTITAALALATFTALPQAGHVGAAPKKENKTDKASKSEVAKLRATKTNLQFKLQALKGDDSQEAKTAAANLKSQLASINARLPKEEKKVKERKTEVKSAATTVNHTTNTVSQAPSNVPSRVPQAAPKVNTPAPSTNTSNIAGIRGKLVAKAKTYLGIPYVWGGTNPSVGLDCSGLTSLVYASFGYSIGRTTYNQDVTGRHVPLSALKPGDLILEYGKGHVTMYIGNGQQIEAPQPGDVVKISSVPYSSGAMYGLRYVND